MAPRSRSTQDSDDFDDPDRMDVDGADADDEGPSTADLERFSGEDGICPECGAEVWDDASICPRCGAVIDGTMKKRTSIDAWWRSRWFAVLAIVLVLSMLGLLPILLRQGR